MKKAIISLIAVSLMVTASPVFAAEECTTTTGSYGQTSTTCKVLGETHVTVEAGFGDISFWTLAQILTMASVAGFGLSKLAERTYWFD
jgi:hypothetical protein